MDSFQWNPPSLESILEIDEIFHQPLIPRKSVDVETILSSEFNSNEGSPKPNKIKRRRSSKHQKQQ